MADYSGFGSIGFLLGSLIGKALGGKTPRMRREEKEEEEKKRKKALGEAAVGLLEGPEADAREAKGLPRVGPRMAKYTELFKDAPEEFFKLGVTRQKGIRERKEKKLEEATKRAEFDRQLAARTGQQRELIEFREQKQKEYDTAGGGRGPTANQEADDRRAIASLSVLAAGNPEIGRLISEAQSGQIGDPDEFERRVDAFLGPLEREAVAVQADRGGALSGRSAENIRRLSELSGVAKAREALYQAAANARRRGAAAPTTGGSPVLAQPPYNPSTSTPAEPAAPRRPLTATGAKAAAALSQSSGSFEAMLRLLKERPEALMAQVPGSTVEDWAAAIEAKFGRALPTEELQAEPPRESSLLEKTGDFLGNTATEAAPFAPAVGGALAGRAASAIGARTGSALLGRLGPLLGPVGAAGSAALLAPQIAPLVDKFLVEPINAYVGEGSESPAARHDAFAPGQGSVFGREALRRGGPAGGPGGDPFAAFGAGQGSGISPEELALIQDFLLSGQQQQDGQPGAGSLPIQGPMNLGQPPRARDRQPQPTIEDILDMLLAAGI